mgnify:FL=1|jgi:imidazolonepropionase-like amidohydrolase
MRLLTTLTLLTGLLTGMPSQAENIALVGGRLIDGTAERSLHNSVILVKDGIIEQVGTVDSLPVPAGYRVVSTEGHDVLPGLWESHAHIMLTGHANYTHWQKAYRDRQVDEIMPASLVQLLLAGITSVRDLGAPLEDSVAIKQKLTNGEIPGPTLYTSGPFLQAEVQDWQKHYRWEVTTESEAKAAVNRLHDAGMEIVKLIDHDDMPRPVAQAIVDEAHRLNMKVVAHAHKPDEIRVGVEIGIDNFEHTGLTTAPGYPQDVLDTLVERTATGIFDGLLFWTPTMEGLFTYPDLVANPEELDDACWKRGLKDDTIADIKQSIAKPGHLNYMQLTPLRTPTIRNKINQLKQTGVMMLVGTDSGIPMKFHCQSTWQEMAVWVHDMGFDAMDTLRAATYWPAVMMGVQDRYGTVTPGKVADIIAVRGNVLKYMNLVRDVDMVMKDGVIYKHNGVVDEALLSNFGNR